LFDATDPGKIKRGACGARRKAIDADDRGGLTNSAGLSRVRNDPIEIECAPRAST
jgi:hypothetical protein